MNQLRPHTPGGCTARVSLVIESLWPLSTPFESQQTNTALILATFQPAKILLGQYGLSSSSRIVLQSRSAISRPTPILHLQDHPRRFTGYPDVNPQRVTFKREIPPFP